jgi:Mrp family chromosome partitioning ATPase
MLDRVLYLSTQAGAVTAEVAPDSLKTEIDASVPSFEATEVAPTSGSTSGDTEVYALDFEPRLYSLAESEESAQVRKALGAGAVLPKGASGPLPGVDYAPYRAPSEGQAYPPYPPAQQQPSYPSPSDPLVAYPPLPAYPPADSAPAEPVYPPMQQRSPYASAPQVTPTTGRRAVQGLGGAAPEEEPPVNDAPLAPEATITVQPIKLPEKLDPHIVLLSDAYSDRADAYRALRRKLASSTNPRVIAITSPEPGEGKTTCAINLALAIREGARGKVLLLEANVRAPSLTKVFGFEAPECFVEQLSRHREDPRLPWVVVEPLPQLHVMAVDTTIKHMPVLDPVAFASGMERLKRAGYEYIVVDTPPVSGSFEVNMIADTVDGVLFAAITMKSRKSAIRRAIEQVMPAPILGVVVLDA